METSIAEFVFTPEHIPFMGRGLVGELDDIRNTEYNTMTVPKCYPLFAWNFKKFYESEKPNSVFARVNGGNCRVPDGPRTMTSDRFCVGGFNVD